MGLRLERGLMRPGERVCAAVSGGADSVALLRALVEANGEARGGLGVGLSAVHVHHGLRGDSADGDAGFVRELCAGLGVRLMERAVDVPARVAAEKETVEEAARELRYGVFRELMASGEADVVATAHTLDDQAETVLMKLLRGTGIEGLGGISPVVQGGILQTHVLKGEGPFDGLRAGYGAPVLVGAKRSGRIVRPLLGVRRVEIEAYLRELGQGWRDDETNGDVAFTRNKVRHELMPVLREFNPEVERALAHLAEIAREEEERWKGELGRLLPQVLMPGRPVRGGGRAGGGGGVAVDLVRLKGMDRATRRRVVRAAAKEVGVAMHFDETERVLRLAGFGGEGGQSREQKGRGRRLQFHGGLQVERTARELRFFR